MRCLQPNNNNQIHVTMKTAIGGIIESHKAHDSLTAGLAVLEFCVYLLLVPPRQKRKPVNWRRRIPSSQISHTLMTL